MIDDLEAGKAGEHLVCFDLIMNGHTAYLSDQGLPYDVVLDKDGKLYKIQVKTTRKAINVNSQGRKERKCYNFSVRRCGKNGSKRLHESDCDIIALVALDIHTIAYFSIKDAPQTIQLHHPDTIPSGKYKRRFEKPITKYPIGDLF